MNKFNKNYYEIVKDLPNEKKVIMYNTIIDYLFTGIEPKFSDPYLKAIWIGFKITKVL